MRKFSLIALFGLILYSLVTSIFFIVDERQHAIVSGSGQIKRVISEPGLYYKTPAPLEEVILLDKRIVTSEITVPEKVATSEKEVAMIDSFVKWRVDNPRLFYVSFSGSMQQGQDKVLQMVKAALAEEVRHYTLKELLTGDRSELVDEIQKGMAAEAKNLGIVIVDVRLKRIGYSNNAAIFDQMKAERTRIANETRANGVAEAERIRAEADKKHTIIIAEAARQAQKIRGEGDAKAAKLYAKEFGKNPEFAKFYRTLEAYRATFNSRNDVIVVDPSSEFFKYMRNPKATGAAKK
ncbi:MAG: protease modulator HflC [Oxalobacter sp.]|nr:MAG: protease modulator HflC [Oxalobacter sp.]